MNITTIVVMPTYSDLIMNHLRGTQRMSHHVFITCRLMSDIYWSQLREWASRHGLDGRYYIVTDRSSQVIDGHTYIYKGGSIPYLEPETIIMIDTNHMNDYGIGAKRKLCVDYARSTGAKYCVMIDDNLDLVNPHMETVGRASIRAIMGPSNMTRSIPLSPSERNAMIDAGTYHRFAPLTDAIIASSMWDEDPHMAVAGVIRHDHTRSNRVAAIGDIRPSWSIYKYIVIRIDRLGDINYDPNLTILGEDILFYNRLYEMGRTSYIYGSALSIRVPRPGSLLEPDPSHRATIDADLFVDTYMNDPIGEVLPFISGHGSIMFRGSFTLRESLGRRSITPGSRINPYFIVHAITGVPIIGEVEVPSITGMVENETNLWRRYTACTNTGDDRMVGPATAIRPRGMMAYTICPPSTLGLKERKYTGTWRFLILYGLVRLTNDPSLMRDLFLYQWTNDLGITFSRLDLDIDAIVRERGHCSPFNRARCRPSPRGASSRRRRLQ